MSDIRIHRDIPAIGGYLQVPPNTEGNKTHYRIDQTLSQNPSTGEIVRLTGGSGRQFGSRIGAQEFFRLNGIAPNEWYSTDPMDDFRS